MTVPVSPADWDQRHRVLGACIGAYFGVRLCQVVTGSLVPGIIETFGVTPGTVGVVLTGMWAVYALVQLPSGLVADWFGDRAVVVAALLLTAAAMAGQAVAPVFAVFGVAVAALGGGAGVYYNPATALLDRSGDRLGQAIGLHRVGAQAAGVLAPTGAAIVSLWYGWRETVGLAAVCVALAAVGFVRLTRRVEPRRRESVSPEVPQPGRLLDLLLRPHTLTTTVMMTLVEFVGVASMAFMPTLLIGHYDIATPGANLLFALYFGVGAVFQPVAGRLSDRYGRERTVVVLAGAGVVGYAGLAIGGSVVTAGIGVGLAGLATSSTPVIQSRMLDGLTVAERRAGFGLFRTGYLLLGASGTAAVGVLAAALGWDAAAWLLAVCFLVVVVVGVATQPAESATRER
ncbi:MAG: MFS transporter [Halolamina sp.]